MEYMQGYIAGVLQSLVTLVLIYGVLGLRGAYKARATIKQFEELMKDNEDKE